MGSQIADFTVWLGAKAYTFYQMKESFFTSFNCILPNLSYQQEENPAGYVNRIRKFSIYKAIYNMLYLA